MYTTEQQMKEWDRKGERGGGVLKHNKQAKTEPIELHITGVMVRKAAVCPL